jgi:hypothetical protein
MAYRDMGGVGQASPSEAQEEMPMPKEESGSDMETFMAPKSAFYGKDLKAGDTKTVKVMKVHEDEVELECVKEGGSANSPMEDMAEMESDA